MRAIFYLLISFSLTWSTLYGEMITFNRLAVDQKKIKISSDEAITTYVKGKVKEIEGRRISIRGFIYSDGEQLILSSTPRLRSCCIGSLNKLGTQITLDCDKELVKIGGGTVYELSGKLEVALQKDLDGHLSQIYLLKEVVF